MQSPLLRPAQKDSPQRLRDQSAGSSNNGRLVIAKDPSHDEDGDENAAESQQLLAKAQRYLETPRVSDSEETEEADEDHGVDNLRMDDDEAM